MLRSILSIGLGALWLCASQAVAAGAQAPRLIVLIVVDQFGSDLLYRHEQHLTGGFRRVLDEGRHFPNAVVDHAPTNSLPGHLAAASGAYPRRHGVVDNSWIETGESGSHRVLGFADPQCFPVTSDGPEPSGAGLGPGRFEASTIVEWVRAADPRSRSASVGTGGGVSLLHAGRARGPVLWFSPEHGGYITSSCYADVLPDWALAFNRELSPRFMQRDWTLAAPAAMLAGLRPDLADFENGGRDTAFPHVRPEASGELPRWFVDTPLADEATLALALAAIDAEELGADRITDVVTIGLSSLDHVGHAFGPYSVEQADALFRMDAALQSFFEKLDARVGPDGWVLALTADHGAPVAPEDAQRYGIEEARRIAQDEAREAIAAIVTAADPVARPEDRTAAAKQAAEGLAFVGRVLTAADIRNWRSSGDTLARLYENSHREGRVSLHPLYQSETGRSAAEFGIIVVPHPHVVIDWATSIHGSPYPYDRKVALMFMGPSVEPGRSSVEARTIDVAPTLAAMAAIQPLGEVDGRVHALTGRK